MEDIEALNNRDENAMTKYAKAHHTIRKPKHDCTRAYGRLAADADIKEFDKSRIKFYTNAAEAYDDDMVIYEYTGPAKGGELLHKCLNGRYEAKVLDIGGGTGCATAELQKFGPYNNVDGLDPSEGMLKVAMNEGRYRRVFNQYFHIGSGIKKESYDAVLCVGVFVPGHIKAESLKEMLDIVKPGGHVVIVMRSSLLITDPDIRLLRPLIKKMAQQKKLEIMADYEYERYFTGLAGQVFILKKY